MNEENNENVVQSTEVPQETLIVEKKPKNKLIPIIIIIVLLICGIFAFLFFGTDIFKSDKGKENNNEETDTPVSVDEAIKFEGIYANENDKMYIHKISNTEFHYIIGGNFEGTAKVNGENAKEKELFDENEYFEFTLKDNGIEVTYHADENTEVAVDTGLYKKVADYSKDNIYKEAVGDPKYLETRHNGVFKNEDIELYVFQISEKEVLVKASNDADVLFDEKFEEVVNEINGESNFFAKSFFDEEKTAFILNFYDNSIEIIVKDDVLDYDIEDKKLEKNYKFDRKITKEEILKEFYSDY